MPLLELCKCVKLSLLAPPLGLGDARSDQDVHENRYVVRREGAVDVRYLIGGSMPRLALWSREAMGEIEDESVHIRNVASPGRRPGCSACVLDRHVSAHQVDQSS